MSMTEFALALLVLLLTPGPTNTLMLLAGAERGLLRSVALVPVELSAYLAVVLPLALASEALSDRLGILRPVVAVAAGVWVLYLAWSMWRTEPGGAAPASVTPGRLWVTTFLNPKGLVMGLVLLPAAGVGMAAAGLLALCIAILAVFWAFLGCCLPGQEEGAAFPPLLRRLAAFWLAGLSVFIMAGGFAG
ncbi:MAG: hypothetical protein Q27BPR15_06450 [Rhodobacter sp. CACIA14H1]|nr:MAG: hypothetical protein Q27BPR15_06450 [Rhodobacter sp. CACIA14H1]